jgi:hypothetical protein
MHSIRLTAASRLLTGVLIFAGSLAVFQVAVSIPAQAQSVSACESYAHDRARRATRGTTANSMARNALGGAAIGSLVDGRSGARRGANLASAPGWSLAVSPRTISMRPNSIALAGVHAHNHSGIQLPRA